MSSVLSFISLVFNVVTMCACVATMLIIRCNHDSTSSHGGTLDR